MGEVWGAGGWLRGVDQFSTQVWLYVMRVMIVYMCYVVNLTTFKFSRQKGYDIGYDIYHEIFRDIDMI